MTTAATVEAADADHLIGSWSCRTAEGVVPLEFSSRNRLIFNGDAASYTLVPGAIRVQEDNGPVNYHYRFKGDALLITFPQGGQTSCAKAVVSAARREAEPKVTGRGGQEHLLKGRLCSWSGSRAARTAIPALGGRSSTAAAASPTALRDRSRAMREWPPAAGRHPAAPTGCPEIRYRSPSRTAAPAQRPCTTGRLTATSPS
jgi:hypothetical protein